MRELRVAFIASSGGGTIQALGHAAAAHRWPIRLAGIVTDRECGAESVGDELSMPVRRIPFEGSMDQWSVLAARTIRLWSPDVVVLFYLRRVGAAVWRDLGCPVWNLHPSLLPTYPGLNALRNSYSDAIDPLALSRPRYLGVTLHQAVDRADSGPIIAQARFAPPASLDHAEHLAFLGKFSLLAEALLRMVEGKALTMEGEPAWMVDHRPWPPRAEVADAAARLARPWVRPAQARSA